MTKSQGLYNCQIILQILLPILYVLPLVYIKTNLRKLHEYIICYLRFRSTGFHLVLRNHGY